MNNSRKKSIKNIPPPPSDPITGAAPTKILRKIGHNDLTKFTVEVSRSNETPLAMFTLATVNRAKAIQVAQDRVRKAHGLASSVTLLVKVI